MAQPQLLLQLQIVVLDDPPIFGQPHQIPQRRVKRWFDTEALTALPPHTFGNAGRGIIRADGRINVDFSVNKNFVWGEQRIVQFLVDLFNFFNHPDFGSPARSMGAPGFGTSASATAPRTIQLGLRLAF